jgi:hypothetical protein
MDFIVQWITLVFSPSHILKQLIVLLSGLPPRRFPALLEVVDQKGELGRLECPQQAQGAQELCSQRGRLALRWMAEQAKRLRQQLWILKVRAHD